MFRNILVAVDGSKHADKALGIACDLANKYKSGLVICHAQLRDAESMTLKKLANRGKMTKQQRDLLDNYESDMLMQMAEAGEDYAFGPVPAPIELLTVIGGQILAKAEAKAKKAGVKKVATTIVGGDPADEIIRAAKKQKADTIILGNRGLSDFKGFFMGSVSHKVSAHATGTCITVK